MPISGKPYILDSAFKDRTKPALAGVEAPNVSDVRGIHAEYPSSTPKYARGGGARTDNYTKTLARVYVDVTPDERQTFLNSITEVDTKALAIALTGTGYVDFLMQRVNHNWAEKAEVIENLADGFVVYFFGQSAPVFNYSGTLVNSFEDDQAVGMYRLYRDVLRGTQLARRQKLAHLRYDSYIVSGAMMNLVEDMESSNEMVVGFSFQFVVRKVTLLPNPERGILVVDGAFDEKGLLTKATRAMPQLLPYRTLAMPKVGTKAATPPPTQANKTPDIVANDIAGENQRKMAQASVRQDALAQGAEVP